MIPQRLPVPINAVYRKFNDVTGWVDFVSNERNSVSSTAGERGFCPPPGDAVWTEGLTEGHWCVQVTVEDGGPNDADGIANSAIVDPGGVAVELNGNNLPVAVADEASVLVDSSVDVNVLANDTDPDGDTLTVNQAVGSFGTVTILADQQLTRHTPRYLRRIWQPWAVCDHRAEPRHRHRAAWRGSGRKPLRSDRLHPRRSGRAGLNAPPARPTHAPLPGTSCWAAGQSF